MLNECTSLCLFNGLTHSITGEMKIFMKIQQTDFEIWREERKRISLSNSVLYFFLLPEARFK